MNSRLLRIFVSCLLGMSIGHLPVRWCHPQRNLASEELEVHLDADHCGMPRCNLPSDWHFHFVCVGGRLTGDSANGWESSPVKSRQVHQADGPITSEPESSWGVGRRFDSASRLLARIVDEPKAVTARRPDYLSGSSLRGNVRTFKQLSVMLLKLAKSRTVLYRPEFLCSELTLDRVS